MGIKDGVLNSDGKWLPVIIRHQNRKKKTTIAVVVFNNTLVLQLSR